MNVLIHYFLFKVRKAGVVRYETGSAGLLIKYNIPTEMHCSLTQTKVVDKTLI